MVINFCDPVLKPKISSSAVTVDGYEVTNLSSTNPFRRNKGFLVESFMKPPVSIIIHFPVNIEISKVIVATAVGAQRSCGLELYTNSMHRSWSWISENCDRTEDLEPIPSDSDINRVYCCIGRVHDDDGRCFCFVNSDYSEDASFGQFPNMPQHMWHGVTTDSLLKTKFKRYLNNISHLVIRITRAARSSACALKWVEVWGQPSRSCKSSWLHHLSRLCWQSYGQSTKQEETPDSRQNNSQQNASGCESLSEPDDLPEEFVDPLTEEMMLMPVLLPSGKTIDQTSLDNYVRELAQWGRSPGDPFTGKQFTERDKPIPNAALKARMDQFLFQHPHIASKVDFRVGRTSDLYSTPNITHSNLVSDKSSDSKAPKLSRKNDDPPQRQAKRVCAGAPQSRCKVSTDAITSYPASRNVTSHSVTCTQSSHPSSSNSPTAAVSSKQNGTHISEPNTDVHTSDLDMVLKLTLAGLPSYLQKSAPKPDSTDDSCIYCEKHVDVTYMYMLECSHLLCKPCLLKQPDKLKCVRCHQMTQRTKVVKAHF